MLQGRPKSQTDFSSELLNKIPDLRSIDFDLFLSSFLLWSRSELELYLWCLWLGDLLSRRLTFFQFLGAFSSFQYLSLFSIFQFFQLFSNLYCQSFFEILIMGIHCSKTAVGFPTSLVRSTARSIYPSSFTHLRASLSYLNPTAKVKHLSFPLILVTCSIAPNYFFRIFLTQSIMSSSSLLWRILIFSQRMWFLISERLLQSQVVLAAISLSFLSTLTVLLFCDLLLSELYLLSCLRLERERDLLLLSLGIDLRYFKYINQA